MSTRTALPNTNDTESPLKPKKVTRRAAANSTVPAIISKMTEAEVIERAKSGDGVAFETLYIMHKRKVFSLCWRMSGNEAEAEDLTQEVFMLVFRKIANFRGQSAFSTWLHRVTVNVVLMRFRKKGLLSVSLEEFMNPEDQEVPKGDFGGRDDLLDGSIDRIFLERAIELLPPGYRTIFVLFDVEGYEHNEIAEMMGCSVGNTKSQLHKARLKLRAILKAGQAEQKSLRKKRAADSPFFGVALRSERERVPATRVA